jgi:hypothetical protein
MDVEFFVPINLDSVRLSLVRRLRLYVKTDDLIKYHPRLYRLNGELFDTLFSIRTSVGGLEHLVLECMGLCEEREGVNGKGSLLVDTGEILGPEEGERQVKSRSCVETPLSGMDRRDRKNRRRSIVRAATLSGVQDIFRKCVQREG